MAIGTSVTLTGAPRLVQRLQRLAGAARDRTELNRRFAIQAVSWITRNFETEGGLLSDGPWPALSPNTILGRRKGSSKILQDRGTLKNSFVTRYTATQASVGTNVQYAEYHERGTGPYMIFPTAGKVLAFPHTQGRPLRRATTFPSVERKFPKGTPIMYAPYGVAHPGLQQRRMLPTSAEILPFLREAARNYLNEIMER